MVAGKLRRKRLYTLCCIMHRSQVPACVHRGILYTHMHRCKSGSGGRWSYTWNRCIMLSQLADEDDGKEKLECKELITWQQKLIPIGPVVDSAAWHVKNNELLFEVRCEFVKLVKHIKKPPPKPPPQGRRTRGVKRSVLTTHDSTTLPQETREDPSGSKRRRRSLRLREQKEGRSRSINRQNAR
mmetsp:Transcript_18682/g.35762  ORF Transcript_18682/g.35762 Transcript_18682/m.35762 type:complete len:184 (-) Transcript_18682:73-624(-)